MADFEADKTSGTGPALVMVHPLKAVSYTHLRAHET